MDVNTGAIIALSTKGDYDPNDPFTISEEAEAEIPDIVEEGVQKALEEEDRS